MHEDQWRTFLAVARDLSFSQAADELHVTQSAVTTRIRTLEEELGIRLFVRSARHVAVTPAGRALADRFQRLQDLAGEVREMAERVAGLGETVSIGCSTSQAILIEPVLRRFHASHPDLPLRLRTGHSEEVLRWMREGSLDVAITYYALRHPAFTTLELYRDRLVLVGPESSRLPDPCPVSVWRSLPLVYESWSDEFEAWRRAETDAELSVVRVDHADGFFRFIVQGGLFGFTHARLAGAYRNLLPVRVVAFEAAFDPPQQSVHLAWASTSGQKSDRLALVEDLREALSDRSLSANQASAPER